MNTFSIDNKKYVVIEEKQFEQLQLLAARKNKPVMKLSLKEGEKLSYKLMNKLAKA